MSRRQLLCLTPVKNEEWILERFLRCASLWADKIIILDQGSDDRSASIARSFGDKVLYRDIGAIEYNEGRIRGELLATAREYSPDAFLFAVDADEALSSSIFERKTEDMLAGLAPGSVLSLPLVNILPGGTRCWMPRAPIVAGFVDDGSEYRGDWIHTPRFGIEGRSVVCIDSIKLLHYQYIDWARMRSKHRWYQLEESIQNPTKSAVAIYRRYHHMENVKDQVDFPGKYIKHYRDQGIDMLSLPGSREYRWDTIVRQALSDSGRLRKSRFLDVFDGLPLDGDDWSVEARTRVEKILRDPIRTMVLRLLKWADRDPRRILQRLTLKALSLVI